MSPPIIPDPRDALDNPQAAPSFAQAGDVGPFKARYDRPPFPLNGPVRPVGIFSDMTGSQKCWYLNWNGQLVGLEAGNRHGKNGLIALYGPTADFLEEQWPQWSAPRVKLGEDGKPLIGEDGKSIKEAIIVGFDQADASAAHIIECVRKGIFNPQGRLRGRGAHRMADGRGLVLHCGNRLVASELGVDGRVKSWRVHEAGLFERFVYQADEAIPAPHEEPANPRAAERLIALLRTWNWKRPLLDSRLMLGGIGASMVGGALPWRPHLWITGGKGTGKTTLNGKDGLLHRIFGGGQHRTGNASAAGIRQMLKNSTVPIFFDELEAGANNARVMEVVELARVAASGDTITRGSADHTAQEFTLQSCFWFSSINIPPILSQDRSRLAILELNPFDAGAVPPDFARTNFAELGRRLIRRMIDGWNRLEATKRKFHTALVAAGHDNRAADQFGTLLACADILIHDWRTKDGLPDDEEVADWAAECRPQALAEINETTPDHEACAHHILTTMAQSRGGDPKEMLATWIGAAIGPAVGFVDEAAAERAAERLQQFGLKLTGARFKPARFADDIRTKGRWGTVPWHRGLPGFLAVANDHQGLAKIFEGTRWQGGVWYQALKRFELAVPGIKVRFGKVPIWAVLIPLSALFDDDDLPEPSRAEPFAAWLADQTEPAWGEE